MKKLLLSILLAAGLLVSSPAIVEAYGQKGSECFKCAYKAKTCKTTKLKKKIKMLWIHKDALKISDDQMDKIKDIKHNAMKKLIQLKADKDIVMVDLKSEMWADSINVNAVNKLIDSKYGAKTKSAKTFVKALSDIQKVLSAEQNAQWKEMMIQKKLSDSNCPKCAGSGGICPYSGKSWGSKGSPKGSMK